MIRDKAKLFTETLKNLGRDSALRLLVKNSSWLFGSQLFILPMNLLQGLVVARYLGVARYGVLGLIITYATLVNQLFDFRIGEVATKYISEFRAKNDISCMFASVKLFYMIDMIMGSVGFGVLVFSAHVIADIIPHSTEAIDGMIIIYGVKMLLSVFDNTSSALLTAFDKFRTLSFYSGIMSFIQLILLTIFLRGQHGLHAVLYTYVIVSATGTCLYIYLVLRLMRRQGFTLFIHSRISVLQGRWKEIRTFMINTNLHEILNIFTKNIDILILGYYRTASEAGYYRLAKSFVSMLSVVSAPFYRAFYPQLARMWSENNREGMKSIIRRFTFAMGAAVLPFSILLTIFAPFIVKISVGAQYAPSVIAIRIMIWGIAIPTVLCWTRPALLSIGRPGILTAGNAFGAVTLLILSYYCVPKWGYIASSFLYIYPVLTGYIIGIVALLRYFRKLPAEKIYIAPENLET